MDKTLMEYIINDEYCYADKIMNSYREKNDIQSLYLTIATYLGCNLRYFIEKNNFIDFMEYFNNEDKKEIILFYILNTDFDIQFTNYNNNLLELIRICLDNKLIEKTEINLEKYGSVIREFILTY